MKPGIGEPRKITRATREKKSQVENKEKHLILDFLVNTLEN